jgi:WD40 repeat protein
VCAGAAVAQNDRRDRRNPELILEPGGRTGTCDALAFTADGTHLLAVGDDKVVRIWRYQDGKLDPDSVRVLRWPAWREQRGAIYALALSPDKDGKPDEGSRIAIGGYGWPDSGSVAILDRATGKLLQTITPEWNEGEDAHAVSAVAFDPSGDRIAFGTGDASVWLGDLKTGNSRRLGSHTRADGVTDWGVRFVRFLKQDVLVSVSESGEVFRWELSGAQVMKTVLLALKHEKTDKQIHLRSATLSPDGKWLAAGTTRPLIVIRSLDGKQKKDITLDKGQFPRSVAFDPSGRQLAVTVGTLLEGPVFIEGNHSVRIYDVNEKLAEAVRLPHSYRAEIVAFHPKGGHLAVAGGDNHEVTLWDLKKTEKPVSVMRGVGTCLWGVALSADGRYLGFQDHREEKSTDVNRRGGGPWRVFDLNRRRMTEPADFKPVRQLAEANGWRVVPDDAPEEKRNPYLWYAVHKDGARHALPWSNDQDGMPRCYTFLKPQEGKPVRLLVGHYWGVSLFELTTKEARRTRLYTGHGDEVTAVAVAADQEWFVSASRDQTITAWSLSEEWPSGTELGAKFSIQRDRLRVDQVDAGSPGWEAGLVKGDEVVRFAFDGEENKDGPASWLKRLRAPVPGKEHYFVVDRKGKSFKLATTVRRRPLWRFFPTRDGEWVLWMWRQSYYDTSTNGDFVIGWNVNSPDLKREPAFYRAEQFRKVFWKRAVIGKLLKTRSVADALDGTDNLLPLRFDQVEPPPAHIETDVASVKDKGVSVTLRAAPRGDNPDFQPERAELWVNDYRAAQWANVTAKGSEWKKAGDDYTVQVKVPNDKLRRGRNVVMLQVYNRVGGRSEDSTLVTCERPEAQPEFFSVIVGIDNYKDAKPSKDGKRQKLSKLENACNDAKGMKEAWSTQKTLYSRTNVVTLLDEQASRENILAALDRAAQAHADDRFVLSLSGHGEFHEVPAAKKGEEPHSTFVFCCPAFDPDRPLETGISSEVLFEKLAAIPCRKVVLLDACRSGEIAFNPVRSLTPGGQGPIILSACDRTQAAFEHKDPKVGHGLFTYALLQALGEQFAKADLDGDDFLDANELYLYTRRRMPELLKENGLPESVQVPIRFPLKPELYRLAGKGK